MVTSADMLYEDYMAHALLVTIALFHVAVAAVFLTALRIGVRPLVAALTASAMLFSISLYSYGYHLSYVMWMIASVALWLFFVVRWAGLSAEVRLRRVSVLAAVLIYFNYFIAFFWLGYLAAHMTAEPFMQKKLVILGKEVLKRSWALARTQLVAIVGIGLCVVLFYPFGRGAVDPAQFAPFWEKAYYTAVNFVSPVGNVSFVASLPWLALFIAFLGAAVLFLVRFARTPLHEAGGMLARTTIWFLVFFGIAIAVGSFTFAPSRHILFLAPVLFCAAAGGIGLMVKDLGGTASRKASLAVLVVVAAGGFYALQVRAASMRDIFLDVPPGLLQRGPFVAIDCSSPLWYQGANTEFPKEFRDARNFVSGKTYVYADRIAPFSDALDYIRQTYYAPLGVDVDVTVLDNWSRITDAYFPAFSPPGANNHPNNAYVTVFRVNSVSGD